MKHTALALAVALAYLAAPLAQAATTPAAPSNTTTAAATPPAVWNLTSLYPDDAAWDAARQKAIAQIPQLKSLQGPGEMPGPYLSNK